MFFDNLVVQVDGIFKDEAWPSFWFGRMGFVLKKFLVSAKT